jgi:ATP-binding cassette subfamily B protein
MEQYDDEETGRKRVLTNRQIMDFIGGYWSRRPGLVGGAVLCVLIATACELLVPQASQGLVDAALRGPSHAQGAWRAWGFFVAVYLGFALVRNTSMRFWTPLAVYTMRDMTRDGFRRVQAFSADWHGDTFAGATVRRLSRAMWGYDLAADNLLIGIAPALLILAGLTVQMALRWPVIGAFTAAMVTAYIAANVAITHYYVREANLRSVALDSRIGGALADSIASNPTVKSFGAEAREEARIERVLQDWSGATLRTWLRYTDVWLVQNILLAVLQAGLTGLMVLRWTRGEAGGGDVAFVIASFLVMSGYLRNVGDNIRMTQRGLADVEDVARYARTDPQVADRPGALALPPVRGAIAFENVTFAYKSAAGPLYADFSLKIAPGERVALVGATGSGKSTFVKLIQRLYDLNGGRITLDGIDIASVTQASLRRAVAVVPQDPALFHRTIAENIAYAKPEASEEEVVQAARRAHAHDFIRALPRGYQTLVGERGVKLSGGERQRVAIARAFLADAPVLVLDEATSSLDVETEAHVQAATEALMEGRTTLVIAHRLSTIRSADRILVFEGGKVVEEGRHAALLAAAGVYARLHAVGAAE